METNIQFRVQHFFKSLEKLRTRISLSSSEILSLVKEATFIRETLREKIDLGMSRFLDHANELVVIEVMEELNQWTVGQEEISELAETLVHGDTQAKALLLLAEQKRRSNVPELLAGLESPYALSRANAAYGIGLVGCWREVSDLEKVLVGEEDTYAQIQLLVALIRLGKKDSAQVLLNRIESLSVSNFHQWLEVSESIMLHDIPVVFDAALAKTFLQHFPNLDLPSTNPINALLKGHLKKLHEGFRESESTD